MSDREDDSGSEGSDYEDETRSLAQRMHRESMMGLPSKRGYLMKEGGRIKTWKKRWFELKNRTLIYYNSEEEKDVPLGNISLLKFKVISVEGKRNKPNCFAVETPHRTFYLIAEDRDSFLAWMAAIEASIDPRPSTFMRKLGLRVKTWKRRYFVLDKSAQCVYYFKNTADAIPLGFIPLKDSWVGEAEGKLNAMCAWELKSPGRTFYLRSDSRPEMLQWMQYVRESLPEIYERDFPERSGALTKQGDHGFWHARHVELRTSHLYYFTKKADTQARGVIALRGAKVRAADSRTDRACCIEVIKADEVSVFLAASSRSEMDEWIADIDKAIKLTNDYKAGVPLRKPPPQVPEREHSARGGSRRGGSSRGNRSASARGASGASGDGGASDAGASDRSTKKNSIASSLCGPCVRPSRTDSDDEE